MDCAICYEPITESTGKAILSCRHEFHITCIIASMATGTHTCPYCRHTLTKYENGAFELYNPTEPVEADESMEEIIMLHSQPEYLSELTNGTVEWIVLIMEKYGMMDIAAVGIAHLSAATIQAAWKGHVFRKKHDPELLQYMRHLNWATET